MKHPAHLLLSFSCALSLATLGSGCALDAMEVGSNTSDLSFDLPDGDGDGLPDIYDNCPNQANPIPFDADGDGLGNACDIDHNNDGQIGVTDYLTFLAAFGASQGSPEFDPRADHDLNGSVTTTDWGVMLSLVEHPEESGSHVVPFEAAQPGDTLLFAIDNGDGPAHLRYQQLPINFVTRDDDGLVSSLGATSSPSASLIRQQDGSWEIRGFLNMLIDFGGFSSLFQCPRNVIETSFFNGNLQTCARDLENISLTVLSGQ